MLQITYKLFRNISQELERVRKIKIVERERRSFKIVFVVKVFFFEGVNYAVRS